MAGRVLCWDMKTLHIPKARPFAVYGGCPSQHETANLAFNADCSVLCLSTASVDVLDGTTFSELCFYDMKSFQDQQEEQLPVLVAPLQLEGEGQDKALQVAWMTTTNQIVVATGSGSTHIFYDSAMSKNGVLLSVNKEPPRKRASDFTTSVGEIVTPGALPMFRNNNGSRNKKQATRTAAKSMEPARAAGEVKFQTGSESYQFTRYYTEGRKIENLRAEDPREALLKMENRAKEGKFLGRAYKDTQPVPIYATKTFEEEEEEFRAAKRQKK